MCWSRVGVFDKIFAGLAAKGGKPDHLMTDAFPKAKILLGEKGYDTDWFQDVLVVRKIIACIAPTDELMSELDLNTYASFLQKQAAPPLSPYGESGFHYSPEHCKNIGINPRS